MTFQRERQTVTANDILTAFVNGEDIKLSQCHITGNVDINRLFDPDEKFDLEKLNVRQLEGCKKITLPQAIVFDKCLFEENTVFSGPWSETDSVSVEFTQDVIFNSSTFKGQARFRRAIFRQTAGFDGCSFGGVVTFKNAAVQGEAKFRTAVFSGYSLFGNSTFEKSARFTNSHFAKGANFEDTSFKGVTDFSGVYSSSRTVPAFKAVTFGQKKYGDDESFWRFVKQSAQEAGYYQLAGECFYHERCASLRQKLCGSNFASLSFIAKCKRIIAGTRLLPELIFGKLLFGYGERPVRVLFASAIIVFACAFFYAQPGALNYRGPELEPSFLQGLYFSTITFTTLGYGDLYPNPDGLARPLAMAEAVAGGCLMALFVVCLAKRFSRG